MDKSLFGADSNEKLKDKNEQILVVVTIHSDVFLREKRNPDIRSLGYKRREFCIKRIDPLLLRDLSRH